MRGPRARSVESRYSLGSGTARSARRGWPRHGIERNLVKRTLFLVYVNLATTCLLLIGCEIAAQAAYRILRGRFLWKVPTANSSPVFEIHPFLAGRLRPGVRVAHVGKTVTTTGRATRWTGADPDRRDLVRVAVVGGSTTFGVGVTDEDSWPAVLQGMLGSDYAVVNFGVPGYTTAEAIIQMALLVPDEAPDVVVFFEGWNDLRNYHDSRMTADYYSHGIDQYGNLEIPVRLHEPGFIEKAAGVSGLFRLARRIGLRWAPRPSPEGVRADTPAAAGLFDVPDPVVDRLYVRNLGTLRALTARIDAAAWFVPQVLNPGAFEGRGSTRWSPFLRNDAIPALWKRFNTLMDGACGTPPAKRCAVVHEVLEQTWSPADFVDNVHFSPRGNRKFARILADRLEQAVPPVDPAAAGSPGVATANLRNPG